MSDWIVPVDKPQAGDQLRALQRLESHLVEALDAVQWAEGMGDLSLSYLTPRVRGALESLRNTYLPAAQALSEADEIAIRFPNGSMAPPQLTPKQATYLIEVARRERDKPSLLREDYGGQPRRRCEASAARGPCRAYAMAFIERPRCWHHATTEEREENARRKAEYEQQLELAE